MGRRPDPERRAELLGDVVTYLLDHGVHQTSLRPLANELGTSTYAFVYHFGSKETLIAEALEQVALRSVVAMQGHGSDGTVDSFVRDFWSWSVVDDQLRTARLLGDARSLLRVQPDLFRPFVEQASSDLQAAISTRLEDAGRPSEGMFVIFAALTGALADVTAADDGDHCEASLERMLATVAA